MRTQVRPRGRSSTRSTARAPSVRVRSTCRSRRAGATSRSSRCPRLCSPRSMPAPNSSSRTTASKVCICECCANVQCYASDSASTHRLVPAADCADCCRFAAWKRTRNRWVHCWCAPPEYAPGQLFRATIFHPSHELEILSELEIISSDYEAAYIRQNYCVCLAYSSTSILLCSKLRCLNYLKS